MAGVNARVQNGPLLNYKSEAYKEAKLDLALGFDICAPSVWAIKRNKLIIKL